MMIRTSVRALLIGAVALLLSDANAVLAQNLTNPMNIAGQGVQQVPYAASGNYTNAYGDPVVTQACYACDQGGYAGGYGDGYGGGSCQTGNCGCESCGGGSCGGLSSLLGGGLFRGMLSNFAAGGQNVEQCGPHYFDFSGEYLRYSRAKSPLGDNTVFSTAGVANDDLNDVPARAALTGSDVGGDNSNGYRLTGRLDVGPLSLFEFSYSGLYSEDGTGSISQADTLSNASLFSIFSLYGTATNGPVGAGGSAGVPTGTNFAETDNAAIHSVSYESELHTAEASYRRYWVGNSPRVSGTMLFGFRYTHLDETLGFFSDSTGTTVPNATTGTINLDFQTDNRLAGFQTGGDVWVTMLQGFRVGGDMRVGIYNNDYQVDTSSTSTNSADMASSESGNHVAFLTEARLSAVADITPNLSLKAGYEVLYISNLVLAGDNLHTAMPYGEVNGMTTAPTSNNGEALYHGWHAGLEYIY